MVRLPARMRTGLKHGHGPLEDRIIVLGRLEVDDIPRGIDKVTEQRQLFREPPAVGRLVDPPSRICREQFAGAGTAAGWAADAAASAARAASAFVARLIRLVRDRLSTLSREHCSLRLISVF